MKRYIHMFIDFVFLRQATTVTQETAKSYYYFSYFLSYQYALNSSFYDPCRYVYFNSSSFYV